MEFIARNLDDTEAFASRFATVLTGKETVALFGDLGAGKTTFVRALCKALGVESGVHSPTFAIVNEYQGFFPIYHFDMYRITDEDDLYSTGYYDYLGKGLVIIEWSENIEEYLPDDSLKIELRYGENENERIFRGK